MRIWTKIAGGAALLMILGGATVWCSWPSKEPVYKGIGMQEYLELSLYSGIDRLGDPLTPECQEAWKFFGVNMVPFVRAGLRARDTWDRRLLLWIEDKAPRLGIRTRSAGEEHFRGLMAYGLVLHYDVWASARATCVPELRDLMKDPDPKVRDIANVLLNAIAAKQEGRRISLFPVPRWSDKGISVARPELWKLDR